MSKNEILAHAKRIHKRAKKNASIFVSTFRSHLVTLLISALGLVAALRWNDVIKRTIDLVFPSSSLGLYYDYLSAIILTVIIVLIILLLSRLEGLKEKQARKLVKKFTS